MSVASSAGYGHTVGQTIILGYLPDALAQEADFELELFGARHAIRRVVELPIDPANERLKA